MKVLGIDYGTRRIGLAIGETEMKLAVPYETLDWRGATLECLKEIIEREKIEKIVVGIPKDFHGGEGKSCQLVQKFVHELKSLGKEIILEDERLTTKEVEKAIRDYGKAKKGIQKDAVAAALILQSWLDKNY
jgi:putative Holliday junction resolvase